MSRRDTIIVALLINAALLAVLFMLAVDTEEDKISDQPIALNSVIETQNTPSQTTISTSNATIDHHHIADEVDSFLRDLPVEDLSQPIVLDDDSLNDPISPARSLGVASSHAASESLNPSSDEVRMIDVTVKRGDALEKIARNNGTTVEAIKKANNLKSVKLSIGQVLRVPTNQKSTVEVTLTPASAPKKEPEKKIASAESPQYYTVKNGDNPWKIAKQFNVKFDDLLKLNGLDEEKARNMKIGDKIRVR